MNRCELDHGPSEDGEREFLAARKGGTIVKCLIIRCTTTKCIFAHCVPCKGADEDDYVATLIVNDILWPGHTEVIVKADNERSIQSLVMRSLDV